MYFMAPQHLCKKKKKIKLLNHSKILQINFTWFLFHCFIYLYFFLHDTVIVWHCEKGYPPDNSKRVISPTTVLYK